MFSIYMDLNRLEKSGRESEANVEMRDRWNDDWERETYVGVRVRERERDGSEEAKLFALDLWLV